MNKGFKENISPELTADNFIEKIKMNGLVDEWFRLNRVVDRIGFK